MTGKNVEKQEQEKKTDYMNTQTDKIKTRKIKEIYIPERFMQIEYETIEEYEEDLLTGENETFEPYEDKEYYYIINYIDSIIYKVKK